jgi:hypothetical protein
MSHPPKRERKVFSFRVILSGKYTSVHHLCNIRTKFAKTKYEVMKELSNGRRSLTTVGHPH